MIKKDLFFDNFKELFMLVSGSIIYALGVCLFLDPNHISPGGVTGIAFILAHFLPLDIGVINIIINIPLFIMGWIRFHDKFIARTAVALIISSFIMDFVPQYAKEYVPLSNDLVIASLFGGAVMAIGLALVYLSGGSTGGTDILIKFLRQKYIHLKTGSLSFLLDCIIGSLSVLVFKDIDLGLYAIMTLVVSGIVIDRFLYGGDEAKLIYVVSDNNEEISNRLLDELEIGVTIIKGKGAYTNLEKEIIMCAFRKPLYQKVRHIIKQADPNAFVMVTNTSEIFGLGFKDHFADEL